MVVDRLTQYAQFIAVAYLFTGKYMVEIIIRDIVRMHGILTSVVSDRNKVFLGSN